MSQKFWKVFGIIGILALVFLIFSFLNSIRSRRFLPIIQYSKEILPYGGPLKTAPSIQKESVFETKGEIPSRMVIKTGWLNLVVKDVLETAKKISKFAEDKGGWVVSSNISEYEKVPSGSITVRVPAESFDEAMSYFRSLAVRVSNERTQAQDITEEYVDLQSRLRNLEAAEIQLLELMKRTGKISEILEVQRELTNVREKIEQIKGRMQYLEQSVKMSSITVNLALSEELLPVPPAEKWRPKYVLLQTWKSVLGFWREFSYFLIRVVVWAQVWVPVLIIIWVIRKIWKKKRVSNV